VVTGNQLSSRGCSVTVLDGPQVRCVRWVFDFPYFTTGFSGHKPIVSPERLYSCVCEWAGGHVCAQQEPSAWTWSTCTQHTSLSWYILKFDPGLPSSLMPAGTECGLKLLWDG
jgi:hypothetical protein